MADAGLSELQERLGHRFSNLGLLEQALTHVSHSVNGDRGASYQRLEFLGDRVLGLAIADMLFRRFPEAPEGQLSRALADLVRKETCASVGEAIGIGPNLRMGKGERKSGLARKTAVLGDACEAVLGAIYVDAGHAAADAVVRRLWADSMPDVQTAGADPKTMLQEWAHTKGLSEPRYAEIDRTGPDHAPVFRVMATVGGIAPCEGQGRSKRLAERAAAEAMLAREGVTGTGS